MISIKTTLLILTYAIALLGFAPLVPFIAPVTKLFFILAFATGILSDRLHRYLPSYLSTTVSLCFFAYYGAQFNRNDIILPAVQIIIILLGVRLVSEKNSRNHLQCFLLALVALAGSSLFNLNMAFLLYLLLLLILVMASLVLLTFYEKDSSMTISYEIMKKIWLITCTMFAVTVPLTGFFFGILPRTQYPLWDSIRPAASQKTGFSEKIQPGMSTSTETEKILAFRAESPQLAPNDLYWRGIVLNQIVGNTWVRTEPPATESTTVKQGPIIRQTIFPEPSANHYLIALNIPREIAGTRAHLSNDHIFTRARLTKQRLKYDVISRTSDHITVTKGVQAAFYLQLPQGVSTRMRKTALELKDQANDDKSFLQQLNHFFVNNKFVYATKDLPTGSGSLDSFLFNGRKGNCELFAVSAATLLRLADIPTRLIGGYLGGEYNAIGGYYSVTEDMAHVWLEVYLPGEGWVMVDPSLWAVNGIDRPRSGLTQQTFTQLTMYLDLMGYYWNRVVITYDLEKQLSLVSVANENLKQLKITDITTSFLTVVFLAMFYLAWRLISKQLGKSTEEKLLQAFWQTLNENFGVKDPDRASGLHELAHQTGSIQVKRFADLYADIIYHDRRITPQESKELKNLLKFINRESTTRNSSNSLK